MNKPRLDFIKLLVLIFSIININYIYAINKWQSQSNDNISSYRYYYNGETLKKALQMYVNSTGQRLSIGSDVPYSLLSQRINGKFNVIGNNSLLDILSQQYGFNWFIYSGVLYISSNNLYTQSIEVSEENMPYVKNVLKTQGLLNNNFNYTEIPSENKIVLNGSPSFINLITSTIKNLKVTPRNQQFVVYRLKYASATDLTFNFNNQQIIIPGVATILQALLTGTTNNVKSPMLNKVIEPYKNQIDQIMQTNNLKLTNNDGNLDSASANQSMVSTAKVQADSRLNTIIIRDKAVNIPMYNQLIELLDAPAPLIQVEVLVVNLNQDKLNKEGINWWRSSNNYAGGFGANKLQSKGVGGDLALYYGQINPGQLIISNMANFSAALDFLEKKDYAQASSRPSVVTIDNIPAIISSVENLYMTIPASANSNNQNSNFNQVQVNTSLSITPHLIIENNKKYIKLAMILQDGAVSEQTISQMPDTIQNTINSQAILEDNQSILVAGHSRNSQQKISSAVPILSDIPLLGWFFKSTSMQERKITTLYVVTPKIVWAADLTKVGNSIILDGKEIKINKGYDFENKKSVIQSKNSLSK